MTISRDSFESAGVTRALFLPPGRDGRMRGRRRAAAFRLENGDSPSRLRALRLQRAGSKADHPASRMAHNIARPRQRFSP